MKSVAALLLSLSLLISGPAHSADSTNETLFDQCKTYQRYKTDRNGLTNAELFKANSCIHYMAGAFQIHNLSSDGACLYAQKTVEEFVDDYVAYSRKGGGYLDQPQQIVVWMFLESCYCGKNDAIMRANCPVPKQSK